MFAVPLDPAKHLLVRCLVATSWAAAMNAASFTWQLTTVRAACHAFSAAVPGPVRCVLPPLPLQSSTSVVLLTCDWL
jgi:hypothetical protein